MTQQEKPKDAKFRVCVKNGCNFPIELPYDGGTLIVSPRQSKIIYKNLIDCETLPNGLVYIGG